MKMKKMISRVFAAGILAVLVPSCEGDSTLTTMADVAFKEPVQATPDAIVISSENKYQSVLTVSWEDVQFPVDAPVTYELQVDVPGDAVGATAWENAERFTVGADVLSKSFLGAELNTLAKDLGLEIDVPGELVMRVSATMNRTVYSEPIVVTVTPFVEVITATVLYMPGGYQGWNPATAATLQAIDAGVFQGYITFLPGVNREFKFTTGPDWTQFYGADAGGNFAEGGDANLSIPAAGAYQITVNLNTMSFSAVPYSWGVIGTATPGGWDNDTDMVYDYMNDQWVFTGDLVAGALKFRLNNTWTVNYGPNNNTEGVVYYDNPGAHTIGEAGNYTVTFALNPDPATANYTVTLN